MSWRGGELLARVSSPFDDGIERHQCRVHRFSASVSRLPILGRRGVASVTRGRDSVRYVRSATIFRAGINVKADDMTQDDELSARVRPRVFAASELFLDMLHAVRSRAGSMDLETLLIFLVVNEASMRPLLIGPDARPDLINVAVPPAEARGAISRALIADKTDLPRETVRRKVNHLIDVGLFTERKDGEVQATPRLGEAIFQVIGDDCYDAVMRYQDRLCQLGQGAGESSE